MKSLILVVAIAGAVAIATLVSIQNKSDKKALKLWNNIISSETSEQEQHEIGKLKAWISKQKGSFNLTSTQEDGTLISINDINKDETRIKEVSIEIYWKDKTVRGKGWHPINRENIQWFVLE